MAVNLPRLGLPIDGQAVSAVLLAAPRPVTEYGTETPKTNPEGVPLLGFPVVLTAGGRSEQVTVKVAATQPADRAKVGGPVQFVGLVALPWVMGDRAGIAWSATAARVDGAVFGVAAR